MLVLFVSRVLEDDLSVFLIGFIILELGLI